MRRDQADVGADSERRRERSRNRFLSRVECGPAWLAVRRRAIPAKALSLKQNRRGLSPVITMADHEHATTCAGCSETDSVQNPVGEPIPEFCQAPEQGAKRPSSINRQDTGDVLPDQPAGAIPASNGKIGKQEPATRIVKSLSESCDREGLAGGASNEKIDCCIGPRLPLG